MKTEDDLWLNDGVDDLADVKPARGSDSGGHIGCPKSWFNKVIKAAHGKHDIAVAMYLYHWHIVRKRRTVPVPNGDLDRLGIKRNAKYRALERLEKAGLIAVRHRH